MDFRKRVGTKRALATITSTSPQTVIAAQSGYAPAITQVCLHNNNGDIRNISLYEESSRIFTFTLGASGTIIWDFDVQEELHASSGVNALLDFAGSVDVLIRYALYDERTPTNLSATYIPSTTRKPNEFGNQ
jgi:hypothetical protein